MINKENDWIWMFGFFIVATVVFIIAIIEYPKYAERNFKKHIDFINEKRFYHTHKFKEIDASLAGSVNRDYEIQGEISHLKDRIKALEDKVQNSL